MTARRAFVVEILRTSYAADPRATVAVLVLAFLNSFAVAASGLSVREVANSADARPALIAAAALGGISYALIAAVQRVQHNIQVDLTERTDIVLSRRLFRLASTTPTLAHLEDPRSLDRISQTRSGTETLAGACWGAVGAGSSLLSLGLSLWLLVRVHPVLGLLVLLAVPPLVLARRAARVVEGARDRVADAERREDRLHRMSTRADAACELRISGSGPVISARADGYWEAVTSDLVRAQARAAGWRAAGWACFAVGYLGALAFVSVLIASGQSSAGDLLMVASLSGYLRAQLQTSVSGLTQLAEGRHTMRVLHRLEDDAAREAHPGTGAPPDRLLHGISLRAVSFAYPGTGTPVMRDVDLDLPAGATVAVVGLNGAGKTTLVKLLTGMYEPSAGTITVDGDPMRDLDLTRWRTRVRGAFQDFCKLETTAQHTVGVGDLPRADDTAAVERAVAAAGAKDVVARLPDGLDTQLGAVFDGEELSHGQWQKLALARAVMRDDALLSVLDEPTAALDPQAEHDLFERFIAAQRRSCRAGAITLLVSHRFSTVRDADLIVVLDAGSVVEQGTHEQLMASDGQYAELYRLQSRSYTGVTGRPDTRGGGG